MPKVVHIDHPNIFSWEINETVDALNKLVKLDKIEQELVDSRKRLHRKKELLTSRILLQEIIPNAHIHYIEKRPVLVGSKKEISITNSKNLVFIMLNEEGIKTGIDVQYYADTVIRVKDKFINSIENDLPHIDDKKTLNIIWSVKETLYKAYSEDKLEFKKQLFTEVIHHNKVMGYIKYDTKKVPFEVGLACFDEFVLTWFIR